MSRTRPSRPIPRSAAPDRGRVGSVLHALSCVLAALIVAPGTVPAGTAAAAEETGELDPSRFKGVNWARPEDNYVDGPVVPEGLDVSDDYGTVRAKADAVYSEFRKTSGANTVRLPINTKSVGTTWWRAYTGAIDAATAQGFQVILSYWEDGEASNGRVVNTAAFDSMWDTVVDKYDSDGRVYFEPMNEPYGYSDTEWKDMAATWIADHPTIARDRILVSGTGYSDDVTAVCADSRLDGTYLALHHYAFGKEETTYDGWVAEFKSKVGSCASRTVLDEFGAPMDDGRDYNSGNSEDNFVRYLRADTDTVRSLGMGAVYWPALGGKHTHRPTHDWYSLYGLEGDDTAPTLNTRNTSGMDRLRYAWGIDSSQHVTP